MLIKLALVKACAVLAASRNLVGWARGIYMKPCVQWRWPFRERCVCIALYYLHRCMPPIAAFSSVFLRSQPRARWPPALSITTYNGRLIARFIQKIYVNIFKFKSFLNNFIDKINYNKRSHILQKFLNKTSGQTWFRKVKWPIIGTEESEYKIKPKTRFACFPSFHQNSTALICPYSYFHKCCIVETYDRNY